MAKNISSDRKVLDRHSNILEKQATQLVDLKKANIENRETLKWICKKLAEIKEEQDNQTKKLETILERLPKLNGK